MIREWDKEKNRTGEGGGGGGLRPYKTEVNGDVQLDGFAFSLLD